MPEFIAISEPGSSVTCQEFRSHDPELTLNGHDFIPCSTIVLWDCWSLDDVLNSAGRSISLGQKGGLDASFQFPLPPRS